MNNTYRLLVPTPSESADTAIVYVVDGDLSVRADLELLIRAGEWRPKTAECAEAYLPYPRAWSPGCLLSDLHLPGLSGLELQKAGH